MFKIEPDELEKLSEDEKVVVKVLKKKRIMCSPSGQRKRCPYGCQKLLASRTIEYHRANGCRMFKTEPLGDPDRRKTYCCGVCYQEFISRTYFFEHLSTEHEVHASVHRMTFESKALFERFIHWAEKEGGAHFRYKSGSKQRPSGKGVFLACNRTGSCSTWKSTSSIPRSGAFRTGYTCTAFIHGTIFPDGTVSIEFCGDHYGHDARMRLPKIVKQLIAQKQMDGETPIEIITYLRKQFEPFSASNIHAKRVCMVDIEELRTLLASTTKRWEVSGIPGDCEIWEEELLDSAGISREGVERVRREGEKTSDQLAEEYNWPHPHVFTVSLKTPHGVVDLPELKPTTAELRRELAALPIPKTPEPLVEELIEEDDDIIDVETLESRKHHGDDDLLLEESHPCNTGNMRSPKPTKPGKGLLNRLGVLKNMCNELAALDKLIRYESSQVKGPCLIAFQTRIRSLRSSYAATIAAPTPAVYNHEETAASVEEEAVEKKKMKMAEMEEEPVEKVDFSLFSFQEPSAIEDHLASALPLFKKALWA